MRVDSPRAHLPGPGTNMTTAAKTRNNPLAVTSVDVARAAGVSQSVVSRAFSLHPSVAEATREKIFAVANRLGYRRNLLARSLITRRSNLFALVTGALTSALHLQFIESLTRIAQQRSHRVLLFATPPGRSLDESLDSVLHYRPDGILAMAGTPSPKMVRVCQRSGVPVILLGRNSEQNAAPSVSCDNEGEAKSLAELLLEAGHRRFAFVSSQNPTMSFSLGRERGFSAAVTAALGKPPVIENGGSSYAGGYAAGQRLLSRRRRPDAIFCASDTMALGLMDAARREFGLEIPRDLSVVGFDDVPMAAWASYELTTVRHRVDTMIEMAADFLLGERQRGTRALARFVPGELVVRTSARLPQRIMKPARPPEARVRA